MPAPLRRGQSGLRRLRRPWVTVAEGGESRFRANGFVFFLCDTLHMSQIHGDGVGGVRAAPAGSWGDGETREELGPWGQALIPQISEQAAA